MLAKAVYAEDKEDKEDKAGQACDAKGLVRSVRVGFETGAVRVSERWTNKGTSPYLASVTASDAKAGGTEHSLKIDAGFNRLNSLDEPAVISCSIQAGIVRCCTRCEQALDLVQGLHDLLPAELFDVLAVSRSKSMECCIGDVTFIADLMSLECSAAVSVELHRVQLHKEVEKTEFTVASVNMWEELPADQPVHHVAIGHVDIGARSARLTDDRGKDEQEHQIKVCASAGNIEVHVHHLGLCLPRVASIAELLRSQLILPIMRYLPPVPTLKAAMPLKPFSLLLFEATNNAVWLHRDTQVTDGKIRAVVGGGCLRYRSSEQQEEELNCVIAPMSFCIDGEYTGGATAAHDTLKACNQLRITYANKSLDASTSAYEHVRPGAPDHYISGGPWHVLGQVTVNSVLEQLANDVIGAWPR
jgi:hypothetical protein